MLKRILMGVGVVLAVVAAGLGWAYWYYVAYDPPYRSAEFGTLIEVHPEIHGGSPTPVTAAIITPSGEIWAVVDGESCATINRLTAEVETWNDDFEAIAISARLFRGPGDCAGVGGVWWFVKVPIRVSDLDNRQLTGADGTPLNVTDCQSKAHTVKRGTICAYAAFPGRGESQPGEAWGVTMVH
jgi:hypothetical protein